MNNSNLHHINQLDLQKCLRISADTLFNITVLLEILPPTLLEDALISGKRSLKLTTQLFLQLEEMINVTHQND